MGTSDKSLISRLQVTVVMQRSLSKAMHGWHVLVHAENSWDIGGVRFLVLLFKFVLALVVLKQI
jgi:hypothetical protein